MLEGKARSGGKVLSNVRNLIMFLAGEIEADGEGEIKCLSEWMINGPTQSSTDLLGTSWKAAQR